jgi:membrane protein
MRKVFVVFLDAYWRFLAQDGWAIASYIGLSILTSLFPFLIFVTALAGFFGTQDLAEEAAKLLFAVWPPAVAGPISGEVQNVLTAPRGGLLTIGAALALYFASGGIEAARVGLNRAYGCEETRPWWLLRLESIAFVIVAAIGLLALAFLVVLGPFIWDKTLEYVPELAPLQFFVTFARLGVAATLMAISLFLAHLLLPRGRRRLLDLAPGVALTFAASPSAKSSARTSPNMRATTSRLMPAWLRS